MTQSTAPPLTSIRCISIHLPWSWFILHPHSTLGLKVFENRGWTHNYRGPLWIHANKWEPRPPAGTFFCDMEPDEVQSLWDECPSNLPVGHILGCVDLVASAGQRDIEEACHVMMGVSRRKLTLWQQRLADEFLPSADDESAWKWYFGDDALICRNPRTLQEPIPARGSLGIWKFQVHPANLAFEPATKAILKTALKTHRVPK